MKDYWINVLISTTQFTQTVKQTALICLLDIDSSQLLLKPLYVALDERVADPAQACLFACLHELQITVNCVYMIAESADIPVIPMAPCSCSRPISSWTSCGSGLIFCSRRIGPRLFCCTQRSRSLTETMGLDLNHKRSPALWHSFSLQGRAAH